MNIGFDTIGNAILICYNQGRPVLVTDPWLAGSAYFDSEIEDGVDRLLRGVSRTRRPGLPEVSIREEVGSKLPLAYHRYEHCAPLGEKRLLAVQEVIAVTHGLVRHAS